MASRPNVPKQQPADSSGSAPTQVTEEAEMVLYVFNCKRVQMNQIHNYMLDMYSTWPGYMNIYHVPRMPYVLLVQFDTDENVRRAQQGTDGIHVQGCKIATSVVRKLEFPSVF